MAKSKILTSPVSQSQKLKRKALEKKMHDDLQKAIGLASKDELVLIRHVLELIVYNVAKGGVHGQE